MHVFAQQAAVVDPAARVLVAAAAAVLLLCVLHWSGHVCDCDRSSLYYVGGRLHNVVG